MLRPWCSTLRVVAVLAAAMACESSATREVPLAAGDPWPLPNLVDSSLVIAWTFGTEHCFSCTSFAGDVRRAQRRLGVRVLVLPVNVAEGLVRSTLRVERISATTVHLSLAAYREHFGPSAHPAAYVVHGRRIVAVWRRPAPLDAGSPAPSLMSVVAQALTPSSSQ